MKNKILTIAIASIFSTPAFSSVRIGSVYVDPNIDIVGKVKKIISSENNFNIFDGIKYNPDLSYSISAEEANSILQGLSEDSRKKSYLKFLATQHNFIFENKDKIKIKTYGKNGVVVFDIYLNDKKFLEKIEDDLGFKKTVCSFDLNKIMLNYGTRFEANYFLDNNFVDKKFLEGDMIDECSQNFAKRFVQKNEKEIKIEPPKEEIVNPIPKVETPKVEAPKVEAVIEPIVELPKEVEVNEKVVREVKVSKKKYKNKISNLNSLKKKYENIKKTEKEEFIKPTTKIEPTKEEFIKPTTKIETPKEEVVKPIAKIETTKEEFIKPTTKIEPTKEEVVKPITKIEAPKEEIKNLIHNTFNYKNGKLIEETEDDFIEEIKPEDINNESVLENLNVDSEKIKTEEVKDSRVEGRILPPTKLPQSSNLSFEEQKEILDLNNKKLSPIQKKDKVSLIVKNINKINEGLTNEDKIIFRENLAQVMKKYYEDFLQKKKKKSIYSTTTVSVLNEKMIFNIKFNRNYSTIAKDNVETWKQSNETKNFVCSDNLLSSMLNVGVKYEVRYLDFRGNVFYSEKVEGSKSDCDKS